MARLTSDEGEGATSVRTGMRGRCSSAAFKRWLQWRLPRTVVAVTMLQRRSDGHCSGGSRSSKERAPERGELGIK